MLIWNKGIKDLNSVDLLPKSSMLGQLRVEILIKNEKMYKT